MHRRPVPRSVLFAAIASTLLLATPPMARPAEPQAVRAEPAVATDQGARPETWLLLAAGIAGAAVVTGGTAGAVPANRPAR